MNVRTSCFLSLMLGLAAAHGGDISLDFNTLPSSQGWIYDNTGQIARESAVFSVAGGTLRLDTIGIGGGDVPGSTVYRRFGIIDPSQPFSISLRARVLEVESFPGLPRPFGFSAGAFTGSEQVGIGFTTSSIQTVDGFYGGRAPIPLDTTQFHDYRIEARPGVGYDLFVDSALVTTGHSVAIFFPNSLGFGDGTGAANARAEVTSFVFSQAISQVPEPTGIALILVGVAALYVPQRRR